MTLKINYSKEIQIAQKNKLPIAALESTIITHGMPDPENLETALTNAFGCKPVITICSIVPNALQATQSKLARLSQAF